MDRTSIRVEVRDSNNQLGIISLSAAEVAEGWADPRMVEAGGVLKLTGFYFDPFTGKRTHISKPIDWSRKTRAARGLDFAQQSAFLRP